MKNLFKLRTLCVLLIIAILVCSFQPAFAYTSGYSIDHIDIGVDLTATVFVNGRPETINFKLTKTDAQYVTIYASDNTSFSLSGGVSTSTDNAGKSQIRIEGDFPIGTSSNPIYYTVCLSKDVTTSNGSTVNVTLSSTMQYWGAGNVCPGYKKTPSRMSGIDLNLADTGRGNLLIQKTISGETLNVDKTFNIEVLDANGDVYKTVSLTVPAGETSASVILANLDLGTYTIRDAVGGSDVNNYNLLSTTYSNSGTVTLSSSNHTGSCNITNTYEKIHVHDYSTQIVKPGCTADGYTVYTCSCGHSYQDNEVAANGHDYKATVTPNSCTEDGFTTHVCSVCGDTYIDSKVTAPGHNYNSVVTQPTCTQDGYTTHTCTVCGDSYVDGREGATGHDYEGVITPPNCTEDGYTTYTCSNCGHSYVDDREMACGHDYDPVVTPPTCTKEGYTTYTCSKCGDNYVGDRKVAHGHNYNSVVTLPDCTEGGFTTHTCTVCGDTYKDSIVAALGHNYETIVTHPTCTEGGYTTHTCSRCGDSYTDAFIAAPGHNYDSVVTPPSCTEDGYTTHTCSKCGDSYVDSRETARGHSYESVITPPSCTEGGFTTHTCSECGDSYIDSHKEALGHTGGIATCIRLAVCIRCNEQYGETNKNHAGEEEIRNIKIAVCIEAGYTGDVYCSDCGDLLEAGRPISPNGHSMGVWITIKPATCTEKGTEQRECDKCEYVETREVDVIAHNYKSSVTAPTCTEDGFTTHTCTECSDTYTDTETLAHGHDYDITVIAPTIDEQGYTLHICKFGDHTYKDNFTDIPEGVLTVSMIVTNAKLLRSARFVVTVYDEKDRVVVENIAVEIFPESNVGTFRMPRLKSGSYRVVSEIPEENAYLTVSDSEMTVFVPAEEDAKVSFTAEVTPVEITITTISDLGIIVPGVEVSLEYSKDDGMTWTMLTASESDFIIAGSCNSSDLNDGKLISDENGVMTFKSLYPTVKYRAMLSDTPEEYLNDYKTIYFGSDSASVICVIPLKKAALEENDEDKNIPDEIAPEENTPNESVPEIILPENQIPEDSVPKTGDSFGNALVITILSMVLSGIAIALLVFKRKTLAK